MLPARKRQRQGAAQPPSHIVFGDIRWANNDTDTLAEECCIHKQSLTTRYHAGFDARRAVAQPPLHAHMQCGVEGKRRSLQLCQRQQRFASPGWCMFGSTVKWRLISVQAPSESDGSDL